MGPRETRSPYVAELDAATHLTRTRRLLREAHAMGDAREMHGAAPVLSLALRSALRVPAVREAFPGLSPIGYGTGSPTGAGNGSVIAGVLRVLDGLCSDLVRDGDEGSLPVHALPLAAIDAGLARHLAEANALLRQPSGGGAVDALRSAAGCLAKAAWVGSSIQDVVDALRLPRDRVSHLVGVVHGTEFVPSGTAAFALGTLEAAAYRLGSRH